MTYSASTVKELIKLGGNLIITGKYSPNSLKEFVTLAKTHNLPITIKVNGSSATTSKDLINIGHSLLRLEV